MIKIKIVDVTKVEQKKLVYYKIGKKFDDEKDQKLALCSQWLKKTSKSKFYSISHSWPYVVIAESSKKIAVDLEIVEKENDDWKKIVERYFIGDETDIEQYEVFLKIWCTKECYFKFTQNPDYLSTCAKEISSNYFVETITLNNLKHDIVIAFLAKEKDEYEIINEF